MKQHRIVFRHKKRTCDVYADDAGSWWADVTGDPSPRGPFDTSGLAVEAAIKGCEAKARIAARRTKPIPSRHRKDGT